MTFPTTLDTDFGTVVDNVTDVLASQLNEIRRAVEGIEAKVGIDGSSVETSLDYLVNNFFTSGRKIWIYQTEGEKPTGWSYYDSVTDRVLAVKGGQYNVTGGHQSGSWTMPSHSHTAPSHSHRWYNYEIGEGYNSYNFSGGSRDIYASNRSGSFIRAEQNTSDSLKGLSGEYGTSLSGNSQTSGTTYSNNNWRPYAAVGIIISKD